MNNNEIIGIIIKKYFLRSREKVLTSFLFCDIIIIVKRYIINIKRKEGNQNDKE